MKDLYKSLHRMKLNHFIFLDLSNELNSKYCCAEIIKNNKVMCYILPSVWLNDDKKTVKWPATKSVKLIDELFTDCASQFEFNTLQIEKLHCYNKTYDEAHAIFESVPPLNLIHRKRKIEEALVNAPDGKKLLNENSMSLQGNCLFHNKLLVIVVFY